MADFAAAGSAQHAGFTRRKRGEVVVQVEALVTHEGGGVNAVAVEGRTQGDGRERLRFAAREQGATVGAGEHVGFAPDGANFGGAAAVEAGTVFQNLVAHGVVLYLVVVHLGQRTVLSELFFGKRSGKGRVHRLERLAALGLVGQLAAGHLKSTGVGRVPHALLELFVVGLVAVAALGVGTFDLSGQGELRVDLNFDGFVGHANGFEHFGFRNFVHFAFDHHHAVFRRTDHHFDVGLFEGGGARVDDEFAVDAGYAHFRNGSVERHVAHREGGRSGEAGKAVGGHLLVKRQQGDDHLGFGVVVLGEEGAKHAVHQTGHEDLAVAGAAFALQESARNAAG